MKQLFGIFLFLNLVACSTASLTVNSVPEKAKILVRPVGGGELTELGLTPAVVSAEKLKAAGAESGPIIVEVHKKDFITERIILTEASVTDIKLDFAMKLLDSSQGEGPGKGLKDAQSFNQAVDRLFEVRKFIALESYSQALRHLETVERKWPFLSATYELKAGIFFLQKKYRDALAAYSIAQKYNPNSIPVAQMKKDLEKQLGIKGSVLTRQYEKKRGPAGKFKGKKSKRKKRKEVIRKNVGKRNNDK